jgi:hypothetical protein
MIPYSLLAIRYSPPAFRYHRTGPMALIFHG